MTDDIVLATDRLTLRPHSADDLADSAAMWADSAVVRHIGGVPSTTETAWLRVLRYAGLWRLLGYGYWCVRETGSGRFVGEAGLADFKREIEPSLGHAPEAGWALAAWAHGRGYATEALQAILAWADVALEQPRTVCMIEPDNAPSIRLAERLGYREFARGAYKESRPILFERARGTRIGS